MDYTIAQYFRARLTQIEASSNPHTARWSSVDRLYMWWLMDSRPAQDTPQASFGGDRVLCHVAALHEAYRAARAFVLAYAEWEHATDIPSRYKATGELDWTWEHLIDAVQAVVLLEEDDRAI